MVNPLIRRYPKRVNKPLPNKSAGILDDYADRKVINSQELYTNELLLTDTVWDDMRTPANNAKKVPGKEAKDVVYKGGVILNFESAKDQAIAFNVQLSHAYKLGTDLEFHAHLIYPVADTGNSRWVFTYSWADIDGTFPTETPVVEVEASPNVEDYHQMAVMTTTIPGAAIAGVSSMLICSLTREGTDATDTLLQDVYCAEVDFHYQIDTIGSKTRTTK